MTRLLLPLGVLALAIALLPSASAVPSAECDADDVLELEVIVHRGDAVSTHNAMAGNVQEGDSLDIRMTAGEDCEGLAAYAVAALGSEDEEDVLDNYDSDHLQPGTQVRLLIDVPECAFKLAIAIHDALIEETSGGDGICHPEWGDGECTPDDMQYTEFYYGRADGAYEVSGGFAPAQEGDGIHGQGTTDLDCEGQTFTVVSRMRMGDVFEVYDEASSTAESPGEDFEFGYWSVMFDLPACQFRIEFYFGDAETGELLVAQDGGTTTCTEEHRSVPPPECVGDLVVQANGDASITLSWTAAAGAEMYYIVRTIEGDEESWELHGELDGNATTWTDEETNAGVAYSYLVVPAAGDELGLDCPIVEVTAVPFFGAPLLGAIALVGSVGAYATWRRRN